MVAMLMAIGFKRSSEWSEWFRFGRADVIGGVMATATRLVDEDAKVDLLLSPLIKGGSWVGYPVLIVADVQVTTARMVVCGLRASSRTG